MSYSIDPHETLGEGIYRAMSANNPEFPTGACWELSNMVYNRSSEDPEKMGGFARLGSTDMGGTVAGLFDFAEGTALVACCLDGKIYQYAGSDFAVSTGATGFTTTAADRWSGAMFYGATTAANLLILCNSKATDAPQKLVAAGHSALGGTPPTAGQFPVSWGGRLWMASGDTLFYSATNDCEDWATNGGSIQIDRGSGSITGLYVFAGNLLIFKRRKILRLLPGTSVAEQSVREVSSRIGTPSYWSIQEGGSNKSGILMFMSDTGVQAMVPSGATGGFYLKPVADSIKSFLDRRTKTAQKSAWATYNEDRGEYYLQYVVAAAGTVPTEGVIGNMAREQGRIRWTTHDMANMSAGATYRVSGAEIQVIGNSSGRVYQMHSGHDRAGSGFTGRVETPAYAQGQRGQMKRYGRVFVDVQTKGNYPVTARMILGRSGLPTSSANTETIDTQGAADGWGVGKWGVAKWGGSALSPEWIRPDASSRGSYMKCQFETTGRDMWYKLNGLQIEYALKRRILAA